MVFLMSGIKFSNHIHPLKVNNKSMSLLNKVPRVPECLECPSAQVPKCSKCPSAWEPTCLRALWVPKCPPSARVPFKCPSTLWVLSECPSARVLFECLKCLSALWVSLNARPVPECLIRCDLNKILSIKTCFM